MTLREKRCLFSSLLCKLGTFIESVPGYSFNFGDVCANNGHKKNSYHYIGLAADINLFLDGNYCDKTEDHGFIGEYWKSLHPLCVWGGNFKNKDGNHYQFG